MTAKMVKKFIRNPSQETMRDIPDWALHVVYGYTLFCLETKEGDLELAKTLKKLLIPKLGKNVCLDRNGLLSLFLACRMLVLNSLKNNAIKVFIGTKMWFEIFYEPDSDLPNMFLIKQTALQLGVDKELMLYYEGLKDYLIDIFSENRIAISKIDITFGVAAKPFYAKSLGVIWNMEDCAVCTANAISGHEPTKDCAKLLRKKCYEKFRNHPEFKLNRVEEPVKKVEHVNQLVSKTDWECSVCMLMNPKNAKVCRACETPKQI